LPLLPYSIPAKSSMEEGFYRLTSAIETGSILVTPSNNTATPMGAEIFSFVNNGVTVTEAAVASQQVGTAFRVYAESAGTFPDTGSIQSGIAIANPLSIPATVTVELDNLGGSQAGLTGTVSLPANGQFAAFLNQIPGLAPLQAPFSGILRVSSLSSIAVAGLRGRYNERGDFLIATTPPVNESVPPLSAPMFFPHIVDSGGYTTQCILFGGSPGQPVSGSLQLFSAVGGLFPIEFQWPGFAGPGSVANGRSDGMKVRQ
jgi:hypothetical protein